MSRLKNNPFDTPKASHFTADEILNLYVDANGDNEELINVLLEPTSLTPLRLLGGKGSGKTHLLRYCSQAVRTKKHGNNLVTAVRSDGYIGLYVDSGALNAQKFHGKGLSDEKWQSVFGYYFEMWLTHHFLAVLKELPETLDEKKFFSSEQFISSVAKCFDIDVTDKFTDLDSLISYLTELRKDVDYRSNNAALRSTFDDLEVLFSPGRLIFGSAEAFRKCCPEIGDATICYMIDEAENFSAIQQTFFNSLIRFREGRVTFKVGARLYGIHTNETMNAGEPIKRGSEFEEVHLDEHLRALGGTAYREFAAKLIARRLNLAGIDCSLERERSLASEFESLDASNDYAAECLSILSSTDKGNRERPYFLKFRATLESKTNLPEDAVNSIIDELRCVEYPLVEKTNLLLFYRKAEREKADAITLAREISKSAAAYVAEDKAGGRKHVNVLDYYKSDLLAQLYREARQPVVYCGFDTIVTLSQGIPRNLLMLLKHIYRRSLFAGEKPFEGGQISKQSQTDGIKDGAQWFWEDAQPEINAASVRVSVEALARLFRTVRFSARPSEPSLSSFSVLKSELTEDARRTLKTAENWSYLIHIPHSGSDKNTEARRDKYQLVPMLAPKWDVSHTRRGTIELNTDFANAILDERHRSNLGRLFKERTDPMLESGIFKDDTNQEVLL
jgi:hypothetical protein